MGHRGLGVPYERGTPVPGKEAVAKAPPVYTHPESLGFRVEGLGFKV